jgi:hypothetical protein
VEIQCHLPCLLQSIKDHRFWPLMKFSIDRHFIYITVCVDEHKKLLQSYYKLTEENLEEITKEWLAYLLISVDPAEIFDIDSPELVHDTPGPSKTKEYEEAQDVNNTSTKTTAISPAHKGDGGQPGRIEVEKNKGEVTPPREEEDPSKKRKVTPPKPSSRKEAKATKTKFETILTPYDFDFIIPALNDTSLEI